MTRELAWGSWDCLPARPSVDSRPMGEEPCFEDGNSMRFVPITPIEHLLP